MSSAPNTHFYAGEQSFPIDSPPYPRREIGLYVFEGFIYSSKTTSLERVYFASFLESAAIKYKSFAVAKADREKGVWFYSSVQIRRIPFTIEHPSILVDYNPSGIIYQELGESNRMRIGQNPPWDRWLYPGDYYLEHTVYFDYSGSRDFWRWKSEDYVLAEDEVYSGKFIEWNGEILRQILKLSWIDGPNYRPSVRPSFKFIEFKKTEEEVFVSVDIQMLNGPYTEAVILDYFTEDGTAKAGEDYVRTSGTLFIPAGTTNFVRTISVPILDDEIDEPVAEVFSLIFGNAHNARIFDALTDTAWGRPDPINPENTGHATELRRYLNRDTGEILWLTQEEREGRRAWCRLWSSDR